MRPPGDQPLDGGLAMAVADLTGDGFDDVIFASL